MTDDLSVIARWRSIAGRLAISARHTTRCQKARKPDGTLADCSCGLYDLLAEEGVMDAFREELARLPDDRAREVLG